MLGRLKGVGIAVTGLATMAAAPGWGGIRATYVGMMGQDKQSKPIMLTITVDDMGNDRIDTFVEGKLTGWIVHRNGGSWVVQREKSGWLVMRQADFLAVKCERETAKAESQSIDEPYDIVDLGPTTINGRRGETYGLRKHGDKAPVMPARQYVISTDPALSPLGLAFARQQADASQCRATAKDSTGLRARFAELLSRGTEIGYGDTTRLATVETVGVPASTFDLPAPVLSMDQVRARFTEVPPPLEMPALRKH